MSVAILEMHRHAEGFCVATIRSQYTQKEYTVHDRWGSWLAGDPEAKHEMMKELTLGVPVMLQDHKIRNKILDQDVPEVEPEVKIEEPKRIFKTNPFLKNVDPVDTDHAEPGDDDADPDLTNLREEAMKKKPRERTAKENAAMPALPAPPRPSPRVRKATPAPAPAAPQEPPRRKSPRVRKPVA